MARAPHATLVRRAVDGLSPDSRVVSNNKTGTRQQRGLLGEERCGGQQQSGARAKLACTAGDLGRLQCPLHRQHGHALRELMLWKSSTRCSHRGTLSALTQGSSNAGWIPTIPSRRSRSTAAPRRPRWPWCNGLNEPLRTTSRPLAEVLARPGEKAREWSPSTTSRQRTLPSSRDWTPASTVSSSWLPGCDEMGICRLDAWAADILGKKKACGRQRALEDSIKMFLSSGCT